METLGIGGNGLEDNAVPGVWFGEARYGSVKGSLLNRKGSHEL